MYWCRNWCFSVVIYFQKYFQLTQTDEVFESFSQGRARIEVSVSTLRVKEGHSGGWWVSRKDWIIYKNFSSKVDCWSPGSYVAIVKKLDLQLRVTTRVRWELWNFEGHRVKSDMASWVSLKRKFQALIIFVVRFLLHDPQAQLGVGLSCAKGHCWRRGGGSVGDKTFCINNLKFSATYYVDLRLHVRQFRPRPQVSVESQLSVSWEKSWAKVWLHGCRWKGNLKWISN